MFKQRPKSAGLTFNRYARIQFEASGGTRDCLIISLSDDVVRLYCETTDLPSEFTLVRAEADPPRRSCRVIWRLGFEFGAKFTHAERLAVPRRAMPASAA